MKQLFAYATIAILSASFSIAGNPKQNNTSTQPSNNTYSYNQNSSSVLRDHNVDRETFTTISIDFFSRGRTLLEEEINNLLGIFQSLTETQFWHWLQVINTQYVSKDLHSMVYFGNKQDAINIIDKHPGEVALFRAVVHEQGFIAVSYRDENGKIKHVLLDVSQQMQFGSINLRQLLFSKNLGFIKHILVLTQGMDGIPKWCSFDKNMFSYGTNAD